MQIFGKSEQVQTTGAQLLNPQNGTYTVNGVTVEIKDGELKLSGTATANGGRTGKLSEPFLLRQGTYIGTSVKNLDAILSKALDNSYVATISSGKSFTINEDTEVYFGINVHETKVYNESIFIMLNAGGTAKPWEPYTGGKPSPSPEYPQEILSAGDKGTLEVKVTDSGEKSQRLIIQTPNGLPGIPVKSGGNYTDETGQQWICDEIDCENQERIQRIEKHIFGNNDSFIINTALDEKLNRFSWREYQSKAKKETPIMCDIFKFSGFSELKQENLMYGAKGFSRCFIYVDKKIDSEEKFKALINGKKSFYVLETPIITPLTPEEIAAYKALHTYAPNTTVTNDSGAGMSLTYTVDTRKYVDKKIAAISAAMIGG